MRPMMLFQCNNCEYTAPYDNMVAARDLGARSEVGDSYTDVECPKCGCLCHPVLPLDPRREDILALAQEHVVEGDLEIDDEAAISEGSDNGCYIQMWKWIDFADTKLDKEKPNEIHTIN